MSITEDQMHQVYELCYLILPSIPEDKLDSVVDSIKTQINKVGGKVFDGEPPFMRRLAYSMSKTVGASKYVVKEAYVGWNKFEMIPSEASILHDSLEHTDELLRFLLIKASRETKFTFAMAREAKMEKESVEEEKLKETKEVKGGIKTSQVTKETEKDSVVE